MKKNTVLRTVFFLLFLGVMLFAAWKLYGIYAEYHEGTETYENLAEKYATVEPSIKTPTADEPEETVPISVSFEELLTDCPDIVAWLYCEDTPINYPVVRGEDNEYYLRRLINGKYNSSGTIFMDYRNQSDFSDWNTILYGHNMNNDSMFGILPEYLDQAFYEEHPMMYLLTPAGNYEIELISGYVTPADSDTYSFPETQEEKDALLKKAYTSSSFTSSVEVLEVERLITLSTCVYDYDNARYALVGVLRELEGEL